MRQPQTNQTQIAGNNLLSPTGCLIPSFAGGADCFLYSHQKEAILTCQKNIALFHDCGLGKTRTALEIFTKHRKTNPLLKMLVVCPLSLIYSAWRDDVLKFTDFTFANYKNLKEYDPTPDIIAINYESLISKKYLKRIETQLKEWPFLMVIDEASRMKSNKSITTKTLLDLAIYPKYKIVMSGTPCPNSELELWGQISFLDDTILPRNFYAFRNLYFQFERNGKTISGHTYSRQALRELLMRGWKYTITPANREKLMKQIAPICHWVRKEDALDLPEKIDEVREVTLSSEEARSYKEMRTQLITEIGNSEIVAQVALAKIMKLRQITSGFAYDPDGAVCKIAERSSKIRELESVLEELGQKQVIIWVQFKEEVEQIKNLLEEKSVTLYSGTYDREDSIKLFKNGSVQYLIAHPLSAAHGLTFEKCDTQIFYSLDYSYEHYEQARNRIHRIGQKNRCLYIHLIAKGTIDEVLLNVLRKKQNLQEALIKIL